MKHLSTERVKEELVKSQNAIRAKYKKLKLDDESNKDYLKKSFRPITEPLHTLIKTNVKNVEKLLNATERMDDETIDHNATKYFDTQNSEDEDVSKNSNRQESEKPVIDPRLATFLSFHADQNFKTQLDRKYGIRSDGNRWVLGDSPIAIKNDKIIIKGKTFQGTPGLYELLFLIEPHENSYNEDDLVVYKEMLETTNAHRQGYVEDNQINSNKGKKYKNIIKKLFPSKTGFGVNLNSVRYEYWDDPNEIISRLRLLIASQQAGNNSVNNEIISIIEELREANIIE
jgi:hypothetical protein